MIFIFTLIGLMIIFLKKYSNKKILNLFLKLIFEINLGKTMNFLHENELKENQNQIFVV